MSSTTTTTVLHTRARRSSRRSTTVAPAEPHALQRRASARFHPLSQSHVFGLVDLENEYPGGIASGDVLHHIHHAVSTPKTQRLQLQGYTIVEGGWTVGPDGRATYLEHGRIEEVSDDDDNKNDDANDSDDNDNGEDSDDDDDDDIIHEHNSFFINPLSELQDFDMTTPPGPGPRLLSSLSHYSNLVAITRAESTGRGLNGFEITEPLPPSATPPPCPPRLRRIKPQLFPSAPSSALGHIAMGPQQRPSLLPAMPTPPSKFQPKPPLLPPPAANGHAVPFRNTTNISAAASTTNSSIPAAKRSWALPLTTTHKVQQQQVHQVQHQPEEKMLDIATEVALLDENSDLLLTVFRDMRMLHTLFFAQTPVENYTEHINSCAAIEEPVNRLIEVLNTRRRLGEEEWNVKTERWHQKYTQRLYSLRRTLIRLRNVRHTLEGPLERRRMKPHHITLALDKLKHHHAKLEDLAFKFVTSFERLRVRHIHWLLVEAHTQAKQRKEARREDQASFEKAWYEDKNLREGLRNEFFEAQEHRTRLKQNRRL